MYRSRKQVLVVLVAAVIFTLVSGCGPCVVNVTPPATNCANHLRQIGMASQLYLNDHRVFPFAGEGAAGHEHIQLLFDGGYLDEPEVAVCPALSDVPTVKGASGKYTLDPKSCSYLWAKEPTNDHDLATLPLAADAQEMKAPAGRGPTGGRMVLFVGGHVKWVPTEVFEKEIKPHLTTE